MRISTAATSKPARAARPDRFVAPGAERGFTLIELMIVIVIIGLMASAVVLTMPDPRGRVREDAERFAVKVAAARDNAVLSARPMGLWVSATAYGFEERRQGQWVPMRDGPFDVENWKSGTAALVGDNGRQRLYFDSAGMPSAPLNVTLVRAGERVPVTVALTGDVHVGG